MIYLWFSYAIKGFKACFGGRVLSETVDLDFSKEDAIMARDHWDSAIKPAYVAQVRSKMKKTSLTQLDKVLQDIDQESKEVGSDTYTAFFKLLNYLIMTSLIWL